MTETGAQSNDAAATQEPSQYEVMKEEIIRNASKNSHMDGDVSSDCEEVDARPTGQVQASDGQRQGEGTRPQPNGNACNNCCQAMAGGFSRALESISESSRTQSILRWSLLAGTIFAFVAANVSTFGCRFMNSGFEDASNDFFNGDRQQTEQGLGFFRGAVYEDDGDFQGCLSYSSDFENSFFDDSAVGAGRAFAVMTYILVYGAAIISILLALLNHPIKKILWLVMRGSLVGAFVTNLLSFSIMATDLCHDDVAVGVDEYRQLRCEVGASGTMAIVNVLVLLALSVASFLVGMPPNPVFRMWEDGDDDAAAEATDPSAAQEHRENENDDDGNDNAEAAADATDDNRNARTYDGDDEEEGINNTGGGGNPLLGASQRLHNLPLQTEDETDSDDDDDDDILNASNFHDNGFQDAPTTIVSEEGTITTRTEFVAEGKKIIREVTHPDGSKTVTETLEKFAEDGDDDDQSTSTTSLVKP
mmetsp:Transcript_5139/g.15036  ORF Transcript_5139/g.15036 Transcript_5139/m.15036 type:complete len:476 (+) Transcript_5139:144-1571(+)